ncbi:MAG TPA: hypothetical protein VJ930_03360, partial [Acidimicrobiia bacterium]|nr:hypothetical protein [Acidimicrobiia bacterium]
MHPLLIFRLVLIGLVTTACSSAVGEPSVTAAQSVASTIATATTEAATTTEAPTTSTTAAADAAPPEMEGVWRTDLGNNDRVQLNLRGNDYIITRGP